MTSLKAALGWFQYERENNIPTLIFLSTIEGRLTSELEKDIWGSERMSGIECRGISEGAMGHFLRPTFLIAGVFVRKNGKGECAISLLVNK